MNTDSGRSPGKRDSDSDDGFVEPRRTVGDLASDMRNSGLRRIHVLAWRDLEDPEAGGSEMHADAFMSRWQEAGLDIVHRTSRALGRPDESFRNGYRVIRRGGRLTVFPRVIAAELFRTMGSYDGLVEIWNGVPWMSPIWCRKPRIVVLHHVHDEMWNQILPRPAAWLGRTLEVSWAPPFYRSTETVTLGEDSRQELLRRGWPEHKVHVAPAGVDPFFHPGESRTQYPSVVAVGRLVPVKRFSALLDQFLQTRKRIPEARLTIVGEGPLREELAEWIERHDAHDWVELRGRVDGRTLRSLYRRSWLVTSASLAEGWGLTLTEAAGCGTPCVATDISGHRSAVQRDRTGYLVPLQTLGDRMADLLVDHSSRNEMGKQAINWAKTLTWDNLAADVLRPLHSQIVRRP